MMKLDDDYLAFTAKLTHDIKTASYRQLNMGPGSRHLEIGSGNGIDSIALAKLHPQAQVTGIDLNEDIVKVSNQRVAEQGLQNITHLVGDAATEDFPDCFSSMRAERVFQHLNDEQIHALVGHMAGYATPDCVFSMVGIDWETLTCTLPRKHLEAFRKIKQFLIEISNVAFIHTAIEAFEDKGFSTESLETYNMTTGIFNVALTAFNLSDIAGSLGIGEEWIEAMRKDFRENKHYFSVSGCTALFVRQEN